jgi:hypothetical protein
MAPSRAGRHAFAGNESFHATDDPLHQAMRPATRVGVVLPGVACARAGVVTKPEPPRVSPSRRCIACHLHGRGVTSVLLDVQRRFNLHTSFYHRYAYADGIPVIAADKVPDEALAVARDIMRHILSKRLDLRADIIQRGGRVDVMATSDMTAV